MDILVDFDNVLPQMKQEGLMLLCTRVVNAIAERKMQFPQRCRIRLYGGWYENKNLTHKAQGLITDIAANFPGMITWTCKRGSGKCAVQVEMARSLEVEPQRVLFHTLRTRDFYEKVQCEKEVVRRCRHIGCSLQTVVDFFSLRKCPESKCYVTPADLLYKEEQKLVDTMMTVDLIHLVKSGQQDLAIISSDDDLWPGIQAALLYGGRVIQVHTRPGRPTPPDYTAGLAQYKYTNL
jgi:hypothetical protein